MRKLRLQHPVYFLLRFAPARFEKWVQAKLSESRVIAGDRYVPLENYEAKCREALRWLVEQSQGRPIGDYLEFGVCHGSSMSCMNRAVKILSLESQMRLVGFDSFEGLPDTTGMEDGHIWKGGMCRSDIEFTRRFLTEAGVDWNRTHLIKGWFSDTCNAATVQQYQLKHASVIMIDSDLYTSAKTALDFCFPLIGDHAVIFFDEWYIFGYAETNVGEKHAFEEWLAAHPEFAAEEFGQYLDISLAFKITRAPVRPERATAAAPRP